MCICMSQMAPSLHQSSVDQYKGCWEAWSWLLLAASDTEGHFRSGHVLLNFLIFMVGMTSPPEGRVVAMATA